MPQLLHLPMHGRLREGLMTKTGRTTCPPGGSTHRCMHTSELCAQLPSEPSGHSSASVVLGWRRAGTKDNNGRKCRTPEENFAYCTCTRIAAAPFRRRRFPRSPSFPLPQGSDGRGGAGEAVAGHPRHCSNNNADKWQRKFLLLVAYDGQTSICEK